MGTGASAFGVRRSAFGVVRPTRGPVVEDLTQRDLILNPRSASERALARRLLKCSECGVPQRMGLTYPGAKLDAEAQRHTLHEPPKRTSTWLANPRLPSSVPHMLPRSQRRAVPHSGRVGTGLGVYLSRLPWPLHHAVLGLAFQWEHRGRCKVHARPSQHADPRGYPTMLGLCPDRQPIRHSWAPEYHRHPCRWCDVPSRVPNDGD